MSRSTVRGRIRLIDGKPPLEPHPAARYDSTERFFLASVLKEAVREYLPKSSPRSYKARRARAQARAWLFDDTQQSREYVFGFLFICEYLGLSPETVRQGIRRLERGSARQALYNSLAHIESGNNDVAA